MAKDTIVLAHGIFGFGSIPGLSLFVEYFNGVKTHLEGQTKYKVIAPSVKPVGSIQARSEDLAAQICAMCPNSGGNIHIIAHSMGGLDARYALWMSKAKPDKTYGDLAKRVKTLITIGTPHEGSPIADAIVDAANPLSKTIPPFAKELMTKFFGAPKDLTSKAAVEFNKTIHDVDEIRYIEVAGDASKSGNNLSPFKQLAQFLASRNYGISDGVVTEASALRNKKPQIPNWPVDHAGEIGWRVDAFPPFVHPLDLEEHLARYDEIVNLIDTVAAKA